MLMREQEIEANPAISQMNLDRMGCSSVGLHFSILSGALINCMGPSKYKGF